MGGYAPALAPDDDEDLGRKLYPYLYAPAEAPAPAPASNAAPVPAPAGFELPKEAVSDLGGAPAPEPAAPSAPTMRPAQRRLSELAAQGAPPVEPLHGFKKALDIFGQVVRPDIEQRLRYGPQREYARNLAEASAAEKAEEQANPQPKPKEEKWSIVPGFVGPHGEPMEHEENSGQFRVAQGTGATTKPKEEKWTVVPGLVGANNEPIEHEENSGQFRLGTGITTKPAKPPADTQTQRKEKIDEVTAKLDKAGLPTDPKHLSHSLDLARQRGVITSDEHAAVNSYQTTDATPSTNLTVKVAGQENENALAVDKMFKGKDVIAPMPADATHPKPWRAIMSYGKAKDLGLNVDNLAILDTTHSQEMRDKISSVDATFKALDTYRKDLKPAAPTMSAKDRDALRVLTSHVQSGHMAGVLGGLVDDLPLVGPMTSYANKLLEGTMTSDQYKQLEQNPAALKLVNDYAITVIANFANMKAIMGSVGKNPMQLQAEIATVPLPYLDWAAASPAFDGKRNDIAARAGSQPELYTGK